jgi:hypothetical protein
VVDYSPPAEQVLPFENLPSEDTPLTAEWLNHVDAVLANVAGATGRVATLETVATAEGIRDTIGTALTAGTGITVTVDDPGDTITIATTGSAYSDEDARDAIGTALVAGSGISITVDDAGNTITVAALAEYIRDTIATALVAGSGVTLTVDDPGDTISIAANSTGNFAPVDHGYAAWSCDPQQATSSTAFTAAGVMHLIKVRLGAAATITGVHLRITTTAGVGLANAYAALYDSGGTRRAVSTDQSTSWQSTGGKDVAFASSYAAAAGNYYVGLLIGTAGTLPTMSRSSSSNVVNDGIAAASGYRASAHATTGLSATPASLTLATQTTSGNDLNHYFVALY